MRGEMVLYQPLFTNSLKSAGLPAYRMLRNSVSRQVQG
jgi:hypothetical protein